MESLYLFTVGKECHKTSPSPAKSPFLFIKIATRGNLAEVDGVPSCQFIRDMTEQGRSYPRTTCISIGLIQARGSVITKTWAAGCDEEE